MSAAGPTADGRRLRRILVLVPFIAFALMAAVFLARLWSGQDAAEIPSALIGRPAPAMTLPPIGGLALPGLDTRTHAPGRVTVVNVFASWCKPCEAEHPQLMALKQDPRVTLVAINYKDTDENARRFLGRFGNPFAAIGTDPKGRAAIEWGVYGIPETFVIGPDGRIAYKHIGPIDPAMLESRLRPAIDQALKARPVTRTALVYGLAAIAEISGCFAVWAWLRMGKSALWLVPGAFALALFAWLLTLVDSPVAGRAYAAYGGVYVAASLAWLWLAEGFRPDRWDLIGTATCLAGAAIIIAAPR